MTNQTTSTTRPATHLVELAGGRTLAVDEAGEIEGPTVLFLHSSPGSRRFDPDPAATAAAGVRLLTVDRPGYGRSTPLEGTAPSEASVADDLAVALEQLEVAEAAVAGWSAGGRYALALAARHPEVVRSVALLGTPARHEDVPWLAPEQAEVVPALQADPVAAVATLQQAFGSMPDDPEVHRALLAEGAVDQQQLADDPELCGRVDRMLATAFDQRFAGVAGDIVATAVVPPGYDVRAVGAPVHLFYADEDEVVPPPHGRHWAGRVVDPHLHELEGTGHLLAATHWAEVLATLG